jgi:pimeloyl-ACP methyl ester carboxylesterase
MESFQTRDGRTLAYRRQGAGPVLVCQPGGPGFSGLEFGDLAGLGDLFQLVILDPRGTGGSDAPSDRSAYALDDFASDLDELREHLGLERLDLFGFSHGGMVAMTYALTRPERASRLVLGSTLARFGPAQQEEAERLMAARVEEPWYPAAAAALSAEGEGLYETPAELEELCRAMAPMYFARWDEAAEVLVEATTDIGNVDALRLFNSAPPDLSGELGRITAPTLVVAGEQDFICGPASARELAEGIAGAQLVLLPEAGHWIFFEQREQFAEVVASFLGDGVPPA